MNDIETQVCTDILDRQRCGIAKYGVTVADNPLDLRAWLQHAYEEHLDAAIYLKRAISELEGKIELEQAIEVIREAGFAIVPTQDWVPLTEYRASLGMKTNTISARLRHPMCPPFESVKGPTGRINYIRPHDKLSAWLKAYGKPRGKSAPPL